jgi:hypothetical protein
LAPENRATQALIKKQPQFLILPQQERRTVDFQHNIIPIIEARCIRCHSEETRKEGVELSSKPTKTFNRAYDNLLNPMESEKYVKPGNARNSILIRLLYENRMPPDIPLTEQEKQTFVEWIDLGARWDNLSEQK